MRLIINCHRPLFRSFSALHSGLVGGICRCPRIFCRDLDSAFRQCAEPEYPLDVHGRMNAAGGRATQGAVAEGFG